MSSVVKTLGVFSQERVIVQRERARAAYGVGPYFGAKLAAESPIGALFPLAFGAALYPTVGLHPRLARCAADPPCLRQLRCRSIRLCEGRVGCLACCFPAPGQEGGGSQAAWVLPSKRLSDPSMLFPWIQEEGARMTAPRPFKPPPL